MVGANLRRLRARRGLTQEQLAEPEYSRSYVSQVEHDLICLSAEALTHFAQRLGVDAAELASDDESAERQFWRGYRRAQRCRQRARWLEWHRNLADAARLARPRGDRTWEARCWVERAEGWRTRHQPRRAVGAYYQALALYDAAAAPLGALWIEVGGLHLAMGSRPRRAERIGRRPRPRAPVSNGAGALEWVRPGPPFSWAPVFARGSYLVRSGLPSPNWGTPSGSRCLSAGRLSASMAQPRRRRWLNSCVRGR